MAQTTNTMLASNFSLASAYTVKIKDDITPAGLTPTIGRIGYNRFFLVNSGSSDGSEANPWSPYHELSASLNGTKWTLGFRTDGLVSITYKGTTTTGSIDFSSGATPVQYLLGFTGSVLSFPPNNTTPQVATYQPFGCFFSTGKTNDNGWQRSPSLSAYQDMPDGKVYGWDDALFKYSCRFDSRAHPTDWTYATGNPSTPMFPVSKSQWTQPSVAVESTYAPPMTVMGFLYLARGQRCAAMLGTFASGSQVPSSSYDVVYLGSKTVTAEKNITPTIKNYAKLRDINGIELTLVTGETRLT